MKYKQAKLVDRLARGEFVNGAAPVYLGDEIIATIYRTPGWFDAEVLGEPWAGGKTMKQTLGAVATAYQQLTGQWEA